MTMNNPYFEVINEEIKAVVESKGDVLETRDSGMDAKVQAKQVEKFIEEKVDCILINAVDWKKIGSSLEKAKKAGIPVRKCFCFAGVNQRNKSKNRWHPEKRNVDMWWQQIWENGWKRKVINEASGFFLRRPQQRRNCPQRWCLQNWLLCITVRF